MDDGSAAVRLEATVALAGGGLDLARLAEDVNAARDFISLLERLWDVPVPHVHGASTFSASWEGRSAGS